MSAEAIVERFLAAFAAADFDAMRIADDQITEWWMVEAKPAESDAFWA